MLIVADSGSTKTQWMLVDGEEERLFETQGLNPHFTSDEQFLSACQDVQRQAGGIVGHDVRLCFYGAGCGSEMMQQRVRQLLLTAFHCSQPAVSGDILGACHAVCGQTAGRVGILGTGSNLCYYDGQTIVRQRISTGFILGDEGSGNHIGRCLLKDYLEQRMPDDLRRQFESQFSYEPGQWLDKLYHQPHPNRFLASLAPFAAGHRDHVYIQHLLQHCFDAFLQQLDFYADLPSSPLHLVGGVAASFAPEIQRSAASAGIQIGLILDYPLPQLVRYCKARM